MSDGAFPDRLAQLRARWESDPSSRIFLQLAEEYRHQGRVREALEVLERGLKEHPGYLSALVAKGRCLLELGEPEASRVVLERVVKQDATQMVANKLLVRAYIETSEPEKARERLDLYTLLNDSDPEIEELRRRLRAMDQSPQAENPRPPATPGRPLPPPLARTASDDVFDLGRPAAPRPPRPGGDVFELDLPAPRAVAPAVREAEPFAELWAPPPVAPAPVTAPAATTATVATTAVLEAEPEPEEPEEVEEPEPADVLFPGLASRDSRRRYLAGLAAERLFHLEPEVAPPPPAAPAPVAEPEPAAAVEVAPEPEEPPVFELEDTTPWAAPLPEPAPEVPAPEIAAPPAPPAPPAAVPEPVATATLGELYLRQGYPAEAERIFREVLRREPESAAAREGLEKLASPAPAGVSGSIGSQPLDAPGLLAGYQPGGRPGEAEGRARKAFLLKSYLERIRRGGQRDVS
ncbi:MAG TPA: tetratricopeptide repeat protein [Thermoanaerobaculia bacterium]|jgi:tetratricopeptide (TPR) repeat protein|nr:tetratricopeptide repeat protein [Thermoanaerobaculia bacterium]